MLAANLDPTKFFSSHPPLLSITAMAKELGFCWDDVVPVESVIHERMPELP